MWREVYYLRQAVDVCVHGELEERMTIPDGRHIDQHCILLWQKNVLQADKTLRLPLKIL